MLYVKCSLAKEQGSVQLKAKLGTPPKKTWKKRVSFSSCLFNDGTHGYAVYLLDRRRSRAGKKRKKEKKRGFDTNLQTQASTT